MRFNLTFTAFAAALLTIELSTTPLHAAENPLVKIEKLFDSTYRDSDKPALGARIRNDSSESVSVYYSFFEDGVQDGSVVEIKPNSSVSIAIGPRTKVHTKVKIDSVVPFKRGDEFGDWQEFFAYNRTWFYDHYRSALFDVYRVKYPCTEPLKDKVNGSNVAQYVETFHGKDVRCYFIAEPENLPLKLDGVFRAVSAWRKVNTFSGATYHTVAVFFEEVNGKTKTAFACRFTEQFFDQKNPNANVQVFNSYLERHLRHADIKKPQQSYEKLPYDSSLVPQ